MTPYGFVLKVTPYGSVMIEDVGLDTGVDFAVLGNP